MSVEALKELEAKAARMAGMSVTRFRRMWPKLQDEWKNRALIEESKHD